MSQAPLDYDYSRSFVQWWNDRVRHSPRCATHASCRLRQAGGDEREFFLVHPCMGENMYVEQNIIQTPVAEFHGVFNARDEFMLVKVFEAEPVELRMAHRVNETIPTHDGKGIRIVRIEATLRRFPCVRPLQTDADVYAAMTASLPILGRTRYTAPDGKTEVICEYPVTVMNAHHETHRWQVDTGPILVPDFSLTPDLTAGLFRQAFVVFNHWESAEMAVRRPRTLPGGAKLMHYGPPERLAVRNELFAAEI